MSKGFKFGQIIGIVLGVVAGSMLVSALIGPRQGQVYVVQQYPQQGYPPQQVYQVNQQKPVFEQALSFNPQKS